MLGIFPLGGAAVGGLPDPPKRVGWIDIDKPVPAPRRRHDPEELEARLEQQRPLTRRRFDQLIEAERLANEAERLALGLKVRKQREKALTAARAARAVVLAEQQQMATAPQAAQVAHEEPDQVLALHQALEAFNHASSAAARMRAISELNLAAAAALRQQQIEDEDDAEALLLLL